MLVSRSKSIFTISLWYTLFPVLKLGAVEGVSLNKSFCFTDARGLLLKSYGSGLIDKDLEQFDIKEVFCTVSRNNVFRGMHQQVGKHASWKLVSVMNGQILDILLDYRKDSPSFLNLQFLSLTREDSTSLLIPPGVLHGYLVQKPNTIVQYLYNNIFCKNCDSGINPAEVIRLLGIDDTELTISPKDLALPNISNGFLVNPKCTL